MGPSRARRPTLAHLAAIAALAAAAAAALLPARAQPAPAAQSDGGRPQAAATTDWPAARGRLIAETWCAACHAIGVPHQDGALAGAPSFRSIAGAPGFDAEHLAAALLQPHPAMPIFPLARADIAALLAYMRGVAAAQGNRRPTAAPASPAPLPETPSPSPSTGAPDDAAAEERQLFAGRRLVVRDCARCHAVAGPGPSPVADAPPFATLGQRYPVEHLAEALAEGIVVNHPTVDMPQFRYDPVDIAAILAYLASIQSAR